MKPLGSKRVFAAFTLIELVVTIAIISVLAAFLFPVLHAAKADARKSVCLSNLRQLGTAVALYAHDYDDHLPYGPDANSKFLAMNDLNDTDPDDALIRGLPDIRALLAPYGASKDIFRCPQDRSTLPDTNPAGNHKSTWFEEFGSSYHYNDQKALKGGTLASFARPSEGYLMGDYERFHANLVDVLFADFHVKTVSWLIRSDALDDKE